MQTNFTEITYDVELKPEEAFSLPQDAAEIIGPGRWLVSIRPAVDAMQRGPIRDHAAFLNSYAPEDEGLYDDHSAG